ncbi:MAG: HlyD family efflux transporter periplasmic adaptor subunit [Rhodospirillales bacterium]|nr:HlyD family efflux transporter periplasmic adaptor subunit [Rhodospirillales bacterium]
MKGAVTRIGLPVVAAAGIAYAIAFSTLSGEREAPPANQLALPAESRYAATVAGSGLIEANTRNIAVGSFLSGIVVEVPVNEGDRVSKGQPLFVQDSRQAEADVVTAEQQRAAAVAEVAEAEALLADRLDQFRRREKLERGIVLSEDAWARLRFAVDAGKAAVAAAKTRVDVAAAQEQAARVTLDRLTVRAPVDGRILKVNIRPGEFISAGESATPAVLMGGEQPLHVRVQVDENDIWRLRDGATAEAVVRGNRDIRFPLAFVRIEPYVLAKRSLTGDIAERVDTRVLELVYSFDPAGLPVYIGQQVDVFIDAGETARAPGG